MRTATAFHIRIARLIPIALAAATIVAAAPAAAQDHSAGVVRATPALVVTREVATYRFHGSRAAGLPAEVTVADRGGQLVATYRLPGPRSAQHMLLTVIDTDLVLQAETESGVLTLQLYRQNDSTVQGPVTGRWFLGNRSGELRGRSFEQND